MPWLPMGPLQMPRARIALTTAVSLVWAAKTRHTKKQNYRWVLALGGRHLVKKASINKQLVGTTEGMMEREHSWGGAYGGVLSLCAVQGSELSDTKNAKIKYVVALDGLFTIFHTQQPIKNIRAQCGYKRAGFTSREHTGGITPSFWGAFKVERR
jgi:hypothetical protein